MWVLTIAISRIANEVNVHHLQVFKVLHIYSSWKQTMPLKRIGIEYRPRLLLFTEEPCHHIPSGTDVRRSLVAQVRLRPQRRSLQSLRVVHVPIQTFGAVESCRVEVRLADFDLSAQS